MITNKQCKAARALLDWTKSELSANSGVNINVISRFERGTQETSAEKVTAIKDAFIKYDIEFSGQMGVSIKEDTAELITGKDCTQQLWNKILNSFQGSEGGEVLVTHVNERRGLAKHGEALNEYLEKLKSKGIRERILSCEGDTFFLMPAYCYRWLPRHIFNNSRTCYVFSGCVAIQCWESDTIIYVRNSKAFQSEKDYFEKLWDNALIPSLPKIVSN